MLFAFSRVACRGEKGTNFLNTICINFRFQSQAHGTLLKVWWRFNVSDGE